MKKAYYYFYYKIYKSVEYTSELFGGSFWTEWKASLGLSVLIYFIIASLFIYYKIFINPYIHLSDNNIDIIIISIIVEVFNYYIFHSKNQWKNILVSFDRLSKKQNTLGGWIVFIFIFFVFFNLIFSIYLMSKINWDAFR
ncbi:hypothetical protein [Riemerella columbina]|uniref:hypothetical protein n=1 Tax=Riemerella columbina TaxID=103810 RepID=UPI00035DCDCC|nr:hypothetical protein [Riemerella columbina]